MQSIILQMLLVIWLMVLVGCTISEKALLKRGLSPLTQPELEELWSYTKTVHGTSANGVTWTGTYTRDGMARIKWPGGSAEGSWRLKDGKVCTQYATLRNGEERCFTLYKIGENKYQSFNSDGSLNSTGSFIN